MTDFKTAINNHIQFIVDLFKKTYPDENGLPVYMLDGDTGRVADSRNLLPELDDYVPFFWMTGEE